MTTGVYNGTMGGTDLGEYVMTMLRSVKWPIRLFTHFGTVAGINALAIHTLIWQRKNRKHKRETTLDFFHELCKEILAAYPNRSPNRSRSAGVAEKDTGEEAPEDFCRRTKLAWETHFEDRLSGTHTPEVLGRGSSEHQDNRRRCKACNAVEKINTRCVECGAHLHFGGVKDSSCWWRFHHLKSGFCQEAGP